MAESSAECGGDVGTTSGQKRAHSSPLAAIFGLRGSGKRCAHVANLRSAIMDVIAFIACIALDSYIVHIAAPSSMASCNRASLAPVASADRRLYRRDRTFLSSLLR